MLPFSNEINPFNGQSIRAVGYVLQDFVHACAFSPNRTPENCPEPGVDVELHDFMAKLLNFTTVYRLVSNFGEMIQIQVLHNGDADMSLSIEYISAEASRIARPSTVPVIEYTYYLMFKRRRPKFSPLLLFKPFSRRLWLVVIATFAFLYLISLTIKQLQKNSKKDNEFYSNKNFLSGRSITILCGLISLFLLYFYSSLLTIDVFHVGHHEAFDSYQHFAELWDRGKARIALTRNSSLIYDKYVCPHARIDVEPYRTLHRACKKYPPLILVNDDAVAAALLADPWTVTLIPGEGKLQYMMKYQGLAYKQTTLPKQFLVYYFRNDDKAFHRLSTIMTEPFIEVYGRILRDQARRELRRRQLPEAKYERWDVAEDEALSAEKLLGAFATLAAGTLLSLLVAVGEKLHRCIYN